MSRKKQVICDKCKKELKDTDYLKLTILSPFRNEDGYIRNASKGRIDLCSSCFKKIKKFIERND